MDFLANLFYCTVILLNLMPTAGGQTQLYIEGTTLESSEPVVDVWTNASSGLISIGFRSRALSNINGIGGNFVGAAGGVIAEGFNLVGAEGRSELGIGVRGKSQSSFGGYFISEMKSNPDLVVGGNLTSASGLISSDPAYMGSSLFLRSNNALILQLDHDNNSDGFLQVQNGTGTAVMALGEQGDMALSGNSDLVKPHLLLTETETNDFARLRLKSTSTTDFWDIAGGSVLNSQLNFYQSGVGNVLQLNSIGNPIATATGAFLSPGGMWTNNSSASLKTLQKDLNPGEVLSQLTNLRLYQWNYHNEPSALHLGPTAEDFYQLFNCGESNRHIAPSDLAAVALAAVQALSAENRALKKQLQEILIRLDQLENNHYRK